MKPARLLVATILSVVLLPAAASSEEESGELLYHSWGCVWCHGYSGHGGAAGGPRALAPTPYTYDAFATFVRTPQRLMPPYPADILDDDKLKRIYEFVLTMEASPPADEIPQLIELRERYRKME